MRARLATLALLWLAGNGLRMTILAVPPVIPVLRGEFHLSGTEIGILNGLPIVLFAAAALVGSRLVARLGVVAAVVVGLLLTAGGSALRAASPGVVALFAATAVMAAGVAVTQPAMPALVRRLMPREIGFGTAVYTNGLLIGEILPVACFPLLFALLGESWRATFIFWAVPVVVIAAFIVMAAPRGGDTFAPPSGWWPHWRLFDIVRLALVFGSINAVYFTTNAFLPGHLSEGGRPDLVSAALTALNLGQFPASILLVGVARRLERRHWPFVVGGASVLFALGGLVATSGPWTVVFAGLLGFAIGGTFVLALTLPALLSEPQEVALVSAAMFTISYSSAVLVSVFCGMAWDLSGAASFAFLPIVVSALPLVILAPTINFERRQGDHGAE
jgi:CP family cyanate transporter-like MFS transporter